MPLTILSPDDTKAVLKENSKGVEVPWMFIQDQVFAFAELLRSSNCFFARVDDTDTIKLVMPLLFDGKALEISPNGHTVKVLSKPGAADFVNKKGEVFLASKWPLVQAHVVGFINHLYSQNIVLTEAPVNDTFIASHTTVKNLSIRMRG